MPTASLQLRSTPHCRKLQGWSLTIRLFWVIKQDIRCGFFTPLQWCSRCILQHQPTVLRAFVIEMYLRNRYSHTMISCGRFAPLIISLMITSFGYQVFKLSWPTVVEGDPEDPFSIATTQKCRGGRYSLDCSTYPWLLLYVKQGGIEYPFLSL